MLLGSGGLACAAATAAAPGSVTALPLPAASHCSSARRPAQHTIYVANAIWVVYGVGIGEQGLAGGRPKACRRQGPKLNALRRMRSRSAPRY